VAGASQEIAGNSTDVVTTYTSAISHFNETSSAFDSGAEYCLWAERLLLRSCLLSSQDSKMVTEARGSSADPEIALAPFRAWASFWDRRPGSSLATNTELEADSPAKRRLVWQTYYNTLSRLLQSGYSYRDSSGEEKSQHCRGDSLASPRQQQSTELRRVEIIYETQLLKEVGFPQAHETNSEAVQWVDQVMSNWSILCGPLWCNEDIGQDGQEGTGRIVLEV